MLNTSSIVAFFVILSRVVQMNVVSAQTVTVNGYVQDIASGERILGANIYVPELEVGAITNQYGFYSLTTNPGTYMLSVSHVGYASLRLTVELISDTTMTLNLVSRVVELDDVEIVIDRETDLEAVQMSRHEISIEDIEALPVILGEIDIQKTLQLLPSVQSGVEGSSNLFVRGGRPDQNLVLLDGLPLYNPSHLFGFFSVFNSSAMKHVELIKGGFPARYGGRLSSVVNYTMKEGNLKRVTGEVSVGLVSSSGMIEGPMIKDRASFLVAARTTYIDPIIHQLQSATDGRFGVGFYDMNLKANYILSNQDRIYLSAYVGQDYFSYVKKDPLAFIQDKDYEYDLGWANRVASLRWNRLFGDHLFANLLIGAMQYRFSSSTRRFSVENQMTTEFHQSWDSKINDWTAKIDFEYLPNSRHYIRFGVEGILHRFNPGSSLTSLDESGRPPLNLLNSPSGIIDSRQVSIYAEDEIRLLSRLRVNSGIRISEYASPDAGFRSIEPRLGLNFRLDEATSVKASYARSKQYVHLLSNGGAAFPTDIWISSVKDIAPQSGYQVATGAVKSFRNGQYQLTAEGYYKSMEGLVEYQPGVDAFQATLLTWPEVVEQGSGSSYGAELLIEKKRGEITGWISYTFARSTRQFDLLNQGKSYPDGYDRRHDIAIVAQYQLTSGTQLSAIWVYASGYPVWVPTGQYSSSFLTVFDAGPVNAARAPDYHRLDLSINFKKVESWGERIIQLGIYNIYNHQNPMFIYPHTNTFSCGNQSAPCFEQLSLFQLIPAVSFRWRFK